MILPNACSDRARLGPAGRWERVLLVAAASLSSLTRSTAMKLVDDTSLNDPTTVVDVSALRANRAAGQSQIAPSDDHVRTHCTR